MPVQINVTCDTAKEALIELSIIAEALSGKTAQDAAIMQSVQAPEEQKKTQRNKKTTPVKTPEPETEPENDDEQDSSEEEDSSGDEAEASHTSVELRALATKTAKADKKNGPKIRKILTDLGYGNVTEVAPEHIDEVWDAIEAL